MLPFADFKLPYINNSASQQFINLYYVGGCSR